MRKDLVYFLPGVLGSELWVEGRPVWTLGRMLGASFGLPDDFDDLTLQGEDEERYDLGDGVTAPYIFGEGNKIPQWVPLFGKTNVYGDMLRRLPREMDLGEGQFHTFPYDWRRSVRVLAKHFQKVAMSALTLWRRDRGQECKLFLVSHSLGGLVASYFCEVLGGWKDTSTLLTLATPHRGAVMPIWNLVDGHPNFSPALLESCTSTFHLTTPEAVFGLDDPLPFKDVPALQRYLAKLEDSNRMYGQIEAARTNNKREAGYQDFQTKLVVANRHVTLQALRLGEDGSWSQLLNPAGTGGDGTVPCFSSLPPAWNTTAVEVRQEHAWLANWRGAIQYVIDVWNPPLVAPDFTSYFGPKSSVVELNAPDYILMGDPLDLSVSASGVDSNVVVRVQHDGVQQSAVFPYRGEEWIHCRFPENLGTGCYRIDVRMEQDLEDSAIVTSLTVLPRM